MSNASKVSLTTLLFVLALSCTKKEEQSPDPVVTESVDSIFNFASHGFGEDSIVLAHIDQIYGKAGEMMLNRFLNENGPKNPEEELVVRQLIGSIHDSVKFKFNYHNLENAAVIKTANETEVENLYYNNPKYRATVQISHSASDEKFGCYYFAVNCGNKCSKGFLITAHKVNSHWKVREIIQIWGG